MDSLQEQVAILHLKVDALQQMIERLTERVSEILSGVRLNGEESHSSSIGFKRTLNQFRQVRNTIDAVMEHKDVLVDSDYPETDSQSGERVLSPEIQIQRLTAQLTAAYNRIAALEEQLLAQRIH